MIPQRLKLLLPALVFSLVGCSLSIPLLLSPAYESTSQPAVPSATPIFEQMPIVTITSSAESSGLASTNEPIQTSPFLEPFWKIYHNDIYGFSFAYPSAYDEPQYQSCFPKVVEQAHGIEFSLGHQSFLNIQQKGVLDLQTYVNDLVAQKQVEAAWILESQNSRVAGGEEAIEINYRFGGTNRFGTATFLNHKGLLLTFNFSAGVFCDVPEISLTEGQVYAQWIDSLRFDE